MAKRVLIVEDDPQVRSILCRQLEASGYEPQAVGSGEHALVIAASEPPAAIVLDVNLPGIDGFETLERLRANPVTSRLGVVILSGQHSDDQVIRGYAGGCSYYVPKPYRLSDLLRGLEMAMS